MPLKPVRTVSPSVPAVPTADVAAHLRIEGSGSPTVYQDQSYIEALRDAAVDWLEGPDGYLGGRALINQTWRADLAEFDADVPIRLPLVPVSSISGILYYDGDGAQQTLDTSVYTLLDDEFGPYVALKVDQEWPGTYERVDAVRVTFVAGYGAAASDVPAAMRHAILLMVGHWYENREGVIVGDGAIEVPLTVERLLMPYRRRWFALA